jgi:hypothetical protein
MDLALNVLGSMTAVADNGLLSIPAHGFADAAGGNGAGGGAVHGALSFNGGFYLELPVSLHFPISLPSGKLRSFGITIRPALFVPLLYTAPNTSFIRIDASDSNGINANVTYNAVFYAPFNPFGDSDGYAGGILSSMGMDISLGLEYPLSDTLGVSLYLRNIPIIPSTPRYRLAMTGIRTAQVDDIFGSLDSLGGLFQAPALETGVNTTVRVMRPFALGAGILWTPFREKRFLSVDALVGMVFDGYGIPLEYQLGVELRSPWVVGAAFTHAYTGHLFRQRATLLFTLPAVELSLGAGLRSQDITKSFDLVGLELSLGLTAMF